MAVIRPFRAWRYNEAKISDINLKFSPLFDVVSPEQLKALYQIPNNSIHLSVPQSQDEAVGKLKEWKEQGIIQQDPLPGIYIYYQKFSLYGDGKSYTRKGFVVMVRLGADAEDPQDDIVLHEDTITHSVVERTTLLEKTQLNVAPTHGLYDDPDFRLESLMDSYMTHPLYSYIDYQGVINQLAIVQDPRDLALFRQVLSEKKIYLADGHHRLASSRHLLAQKLQSGEAMAPDSMVNYHLMYLTNLRSDDIRILPIHRLVHLPKEPWNEESLVEPFKAFFEVEDITSHRSPVYEAVQKRKRSFGLIWMHKHYLITLRPEMDPIRDNPLPIPDAVKELDYTVLHYFVFDRIFGMSYREQHGRPEIQYIKDYPTILKTAMADPTQLGFITPSTSMDEMMSVCNSGALMPQKSTYFYPKVVCGLLFASIDDHENNSSFDIGFRFTPA